MHAGKPHRGAQRVSVDACRARPRDGGRGRARCGLRRAARCRPRWRSSRRSSRSRSPWSSRRCSSPGRARRSARTYALIFEGGFGSRFAWSETLTRATPLILTGLAAAIAFRAHLYNIGAEGQLYAGRARGGRRRRAARRHRLRPARRRCCSRDDRGGRARRRAADGAARAREDAPRRRRGRHDAAAQLHRAAVRVDDARRTDEGPDRDGLAAERRAARRRSSLPKLVRAHARARGAGDRDRARGARVGACCA